MKPFVKVKSIITPLEKANVDTDQIVPKQFLKLVQKSGFGRYLFYNWRYDDNGNMRQDFVLNNTLYANSKILVSRENFGCGSSREHAVWALLDYGFCVVIATSFADIFFSNCFKNGILPITLEDKLISKLQSETKEVKVDLENQTITTNTEVIQFDIDPHKKRILLEGLDDIAQTMHFEDEISVFESTSSIPSLL